MLFQEPFQEPFPNPLSPPVSGYTIIINGDTITTVDGTSANIDVAIGNGEYTVMVVANNDIGPSYGNPFLHIGKSSITLTSLYTIIALQSPITTSDVTTVTITCVTIRGAGCGFTLTPGNMMGSADHGGCFTFTGLNPNTTYTYTATLTGVANVDYTVNGTVTTMPNIPVSIHHTAFMTGIAVSIILYVRCIIISHYNINIGCNNHPAPNDSMPNINHPVSNDSMSTC